MSKVCSKCKRTLHEREFPAQYTYCKACRNQDLKIKREALRVQQKYQVNLMKQWFCVPSEIVDFHKRNNLPLPNSELY